MKPDMDEEAVIHYLTESLDDVEVVEASGDRFFFYEPGGDTPSDRRFPFATLVTSDNYEHVSDLNRPGVFRLNIGVSRDTYRKLFGQDAPRPGEDGIIDTGHDFAALDQIMPHPVYAPQFWIGMLNPSTETFESVKTLLAEAHARAISRHEKMHRGQET